MVAESMVLAYFYLWHELVNASALLQLYDWIKEFLLSNFNLFLQILYAICYEFAATYQNNFSIYSNQFSWEMFSKNGFQSCQLCFIKRKKRGLYYLSENFAFKYCVPNSRRRYIYSLLPRALESIIFRVSNCARFYVYHNFLVNWF